jgi:hypothetical protein
LPFAFAIAAVWLYIKRRPSAAESYTSRLAPWSGRTVEAAVVLEEKPEPIQPEPLPPDDRVVGRVVVMDEDAIRNGQLDSIREYEMRDKPLVLGSGGSVDIRLDDEGDLIAAEEARLWVQKGRLVYHKLTTLSAMATEGVTSGWMFLESGETMNLGRYRIVFQLQAPEPGTPAEEAQQAAGSGSQKRADGAPDMAPQEHGMRLQPLWTRTGDDDQPLPAPTD